MLIIDKQQFFVTQFDNYSMSAYNKDAFSYLSINESLSKLRLSNPAIFSINHDFGFTLFFYWCVYLIAESNVGKNWEKFI